MLLTEIVTAAAVVGSIVSPAIPGCGLISSFLLKMGIVTVAVQAAETVEQAAKGRDVTTPLFKTIYDAAIVTGCIMLVANGFIPGSIAAIGALILTVSVGDYKHTKLFNQRQEA